LDVHIITFIHSCHCERDVCNIRLTHRIVLLILFPVKKEILINNKQLQAVFEQAAVGMVIVEDAKSRFVKVNHRFCEIVGYPAEELLKGSIHDITHPEDLRTDLNHVERITAGIARESSWEKRYRKKDGTVIWARVFVTPLDPSEARPTLRLGVIDDITDRKRAEETLRESEEKFRLLIENAPDAIYVHADARFIYLNRAAVNLFGAETADQLTGSPIMDRFNTEYHGMITKRLHDLYQERNKLPIVEQVYLRLDGSSVPVEAHAIPITYNNKNAALTFVRDITERKQAEKALRESEERYRTLVENASDIVFRLDDTGHITFVNPAALRIIGYQEKEIIGRHYPTFIRPDMQEDAMKFFGRQFVKGIPNTYSEYPVVVKDGREIWLGQNTQLIFQDSKVVAFQAMARDITERKEMEALLRESENRYRELSVVDDLTQLYNSRHFYFQLKIEVDRSNRYEQPLTLLLLDLDNFKTFNDAYGHVEGDQVLWRLGQVVKRCLRETDFAYRYGGEEFTIILPMTTSADGAVTAERIRTEFKKETFSPAQDQDVHVTVSIGLAQYRPQEEMKAFVHRVDQLMYQGKKGGKDRVCTELAAGSPVRPGRRFSGNP
jgi:diguanylate cyclase (GGDEF)-like protein/PAS domain S-box-containing protein